MNNVLEFFLGVRDEVILSAQFIRISAEFRFRAMGYVSAHSLDSGTLSELRLIFDFGSSR